MREGDSYTIVLTVNGKLTSRLKEALEQKYPDSNAINGIQNMINDAFSNGDLGVLQAESNVSFTKLKKAE